MGASYIDYILADSTLIPDELRPFYSEKIVKLPHTYQVNDRRRKSYDKFPGRSACSLPENGFVYCSFNDVYKITPEVFDTWMRILQRVPGSVLWVYANNASAQENLKNEARARGIETERIVFANSVSHDEHMARHSLADLFLDTFPYNAHTTASDALFSALPVLTLSGQSFASRVAASLLSAAGVPELITTTRGDYEEMAVRLALESYPLQAIRTRLRDAIATAPLFDTPLLTRNIEAAYVAMYDRYHAGLPPDHLEIGSNTKPGVVQ